MKPLVSVIVRTKDRSGLVGKALKSIYAQTHRPIEVVIINDGGCALDIEGLKGILRDVHMNYIRLESNSGRAHAGNIGIINAKGKYIGFLDDDDEFYPEHIETLVVFLEQGNYKVVYSAVEVVKKIYNSNNCNVISEDKFSFAREFSYEDLLIANYMPIISLLFEANFVKSLMFDESFELYEDWDLLIRAGETTKLHFVNKITASYNHWGDSQIAFKSPAEVIKQATLKIFTKHLNKFNPRLIYRLCVEEWTNKLEVNELQRTIQSKDELLKDYERRIQQLETNIAENEANVKTIVNTRGWKYLEKYRRLRDRIRTAVF